MIHPNPPPPLRPYEFVVQRVSRAMAEVMISPVHASLHVFSKTFCPKLDFFYCETFIASFLQGTVIMETDLFQLCSNCARDMTRFCETTHDKIHEYYSVF